MFIAMISACPGCLGLSSWLSLLLATGFDLSSVNVLYLVAGHATKVRAIATMPGLSQGSFWRSEANHGQDGLAAFAAMHIHAGHFQITYYLLFLLLAIAVGAGGGRCDSKRCPRS